MPGTVNGGRAAALSARGPGLRRKEWSLLLLLAPALAYFIVYHIVPLFGMVLAFQDFRIVGKSPFVGLKHFKALFSSPSFMQVILNTLIISFMKIVLYFPLPIVFALLLNEVRSSFLRKFIQSTTYLPHFLSWVVIAGVWIAFLSPGSGGMNEIRQLLGMPALDYMTDKNSIRWVLFRLGKLAKPGLGFDHLPGRPSPPSARASTSRPIWTAPAQPRKCCSSPCPNSSRPW